MPTKHGNARRDDVKEDMDRVMAALHRVEDKIDKMLSRDR
jgi:predicted transcriptional regulator